MTSFLLFFTFCIFSYYRQLRFLHILQQEAYLPKRFSRWFLEKRPFDKRLTIGLLFCSFFSATKLALLWLAIFIFLEPNPKKNAKVPLVMTPRATEIQLITFFISIVLGTASLLGPLGIIFAVQVIPLNLMAAFFLLSPREKRKQNNFKKEAQQKLKKIAPFTIGITGSYGKTSTKSLLGQLLRITLGPTHWPSKGINTDMGIAKNLREEMSPWTRYLVVEMAAYGKGSIARLCRFTPPQAAILTTIGTAHLERFGSQKRIQETKAELIEALSPGNLLVANGDDPLVREVAENHPELNVLFFGFFAKDLDCRIISWEITEKLITEFTLSWKGKILKGKTPQLGMTALLNIAAVIAMVCELGADPDLAISALAHLPSVDNRLKSEKGKGVTYLHDAYNSNPKGFSSALEILKKVHAKRRILMTPGMIELGEEHVSAHKKIAEQAASVCDKILLVGPNSEQLLDSLKELKFPKEKIFYFSNRTEALKNLQSEKQEGDAVLIENDLPDLYEEMFKT